MGHAVLFSPTDRTEEHRCQRGACQSSARQMNTDSSQAVCNLSVGDYNRSTLPYRKTFCVIFWCKSCVAIFVEIDKEIVVFRCSATQIFVERSPLAIFRVAIPTQPHLERPYIEARKTRFRHSVWHVSQQQIFNANEKILPSFNNPLTINGLRNWAENSVFPPNRFVVAANDIDFNIDCCHSSHSSTHKMRFL